MPQVLCPTKQICTQCGGSGRLHLAVCSGPAPCYVCAGTGCVTQQIDLSTYAGLAQATCLRDLYRRGRAAIRSAMEVQALAEANGSRDVVIASAARVVVHRAYELAHYRLLHGHDRSPAQQILEAA